MKRENEEYYGIFFSSNIGGRSPPTINRIKAFYIQCYSRHSRKEIQGERVKREGVRRGGVTCCEPGLPNL